MTDQRHRNAYKRAWRNRRNYERRSAEAAKMFKRMNSSWERWYQALEDMETFSQNPNNKKEVSK